MHWSEVWEGKEPIYVASRLALRPASWLYALGWQTYLAIYQLGFKQPREPHIPVLCVGNLAVGGSGKSPVVRHLVNVLREIGWEVVVSCSAYGSPSEEAARFAEDGQLDPYQWGDEPALMREWIPDLPLIVGRRRVLAAELCQERYPRAVMLMDDGFQHLPLQKHVTLILDRSARANRACLPAGPYREPYGNRKRADLTLPDQFRVEYSALSFGLDKPGTANLLCALGTPQGFVDAVRQSGVEVKVQRLLRDHDTLQAGNLFEGLSPDTPLIVTEKDWVKLRTRKDLGARRIVVAKREARIEPVAEFREWITNRLNEYSQQPASQ